MREGEIDSAQVQLPQFLGLGVGGGGVRGAKTEMAENYSIWQPFSDDAVTWKNDARPAVRSTYSELICIKYNWYEKKRKHCMEENFVKIVHLGQPKFFFYYRHKKVPIVEPQKM